jgi:hypothetical protein
VIDLQDPWLTNYYELPGARKPPGGWKYKLAKLQARLLEGWSFEKASGFISVSEGYFTDLEKRYTWFPSIARATLNFGASAEDFIIALKNKSPISPEPEPKKISLVYTGAAGPIMPTALNAFCDALIIYGQHYPEKMKNFRFEFIGTSYAAPEDAKASVLPIAEKHGLGHFFWEIPIRQGHLECLRRQSNADILLLLGSTDLSYSPSKLYQYFLAKRPILAITFPGSILQHKLERLNCATIVSVPLTAGEPWNREILWNFLDNALKKFPPGSLPEADTESFNHRFSAEHLTQRCCQLFDMAWQKNQEAPS